MTVSNFCKQGTFSQHHVGLISTKTLLTSQVRQKFKSFTSFMSDLTLIKSVKNDVINVWSVTLFFLNFNSTNDVKIKDKKHQYVTSDVI